MALKAQVAKLTKLAGALPRGAVNNAAIEANWRAWLHTLFGRVFTAQLAGFHEEYWQWCWDAFTAKRDGREFPEGNAFFTIWSRGFAKSTNAEITPLAEAALLGEGFCLYVSGTQDLANKHLASIEDLLLSDTVKAQYPQLAEPKRSSVSGMTKSWRQEALTTRGGYSIVAVGLDAGVRGIKVGVQRPSLIVLDDIDEREDSPALSLKKLERLTHSILPTGGKQTIIVCAQNLIHRHGVINRIYQNKVSALSNRRISGPHKAIEDLETTRDGLRDVITAGRPTWPHLGLRECQEFIDNSGLDAFKAEYQHDLTAAQQGLVIPEFDEDIHIISWSRFQAVYRSPWVPQDWAIEIGCDWGSTGLDKHPCVVSFVATSAQNTDLPDIAFLFGALTFGADCLVDEVAEAIKQFLAPDKYLGRWFDYADRVERLRMSHEAKSERDTMRVKHGLPFNACDAAKTAGIAQLRHFMRVDESKPHPFKPGAMGATGLYWIVADDQLTAAKDDKGLFRHREEIIDWRWKPTPLMDGGMSKDEPVKFGDDALDSLRMIAAAWAPRSVELTVAEKAKRAAPAYAQRIIEKAESPGPHTYSEREQMEGFSADFWASRRNQQTDNRPWSADIVAPDDDPWSDLL